MLGAIRSRAALWTAFAVVHAGLAFLGIVVAPASSFADVDLYRWWMHLGLDYATWPVLDGPWVYPAGALVPMVLPALAGTTSSVGYALGWCALVTALDAAATAALLGGAAAGERRSAAGAWWWLAFLALLGPVAVGRLDAVVTPLMVVALLTTLRRPGVAAALLTAGAWIKVAPGALLLAVLAAARRPLRHVVPAAAVSAVVVGLVAAGGGLAHVASFLTTQGTRGLQVEAVGATPWMLARGWREDVAAVFNDELVTWEVHGPGVVGAVRLLDVLLVLAVAATAGALWLARLEGRGAEALLPGALVLVLTLVVTNKVGSPQLLTWLAAPLAVAMSRPGTTARRWRRRVGGTALVAAALTQVVFPWGYPAMLAGEAPVTLALAVRNVALVVLLGLAVAGLAAAIGGRPRAAVPDARPAVPDAGQPS